MHLSLVTRGIEQTTKQFFKSLSEQFLPFHGFYDGQMQDGTLQVRVCPIQLWDICFPEPMLEPMLTTLFPNGWKGMGKSREYLSLALRIAMGFEKLPEKWDNSKRISHSGTNMNTEMIGIGMKHDDYFLCGTGKKISWDEFQKLPDDAKKLYWEGI